MQALSKEDLDKDMMEWWDKLQAQKAQRPQKERPTIQVEVQHYTEVEKVPTPPPDEIIQG